ncbi:MAG: hypothetical protein EBS51_10305 [Planctomycetia bacterium]|nr:hypothetical protein [Planctomycetia bacterium]
MTHDDPHRHAEDGGRRADLDADRGSAALHDLLSAWIDGRLDEAGVARLDELLRASPAARDTFREWVGLDALLATMAERAPSVGDDAGASRGNPTADTPPRRPAASAWREPRGRWRATAGWAVAAVLIGLVGVVWLRRPIDPRPIDAAVTGGCAAVGQVIDAVVEGSPIDGAAVRPGASLGPGPVRVTQGLIQLEFFSGAMLWVEGPADLEIISAWEARLRAGRTRAQVPPPARGFVLHAPGARLEDLGTSFALNVEDDGTAAVHVFDGEVAVQPHAGDDTTLAAGGGIVLDRAGHASDGGRPRDTGRPRDEDQSAGGSAATAFLALDDMAAAAEDRLRERRAAWSRWSETARDDPRLVAFYRFDAPDAPERGGRVRNMADPPGGARDGAAVGVTWTGGRWPGTGAVAFRRAGGRVRVAIDGVYEAVSLACWARVDAVDREYNSLFLTDGYDPGEPHWQIFSDGSLMFSIAYPPPGGATGRFNQTYFSRPVFTVDTLGEWHHVAVTYDGATGEVVQYFDGEVVGREVSRLHAAGRPIRIGPAEIGNWGLPTPGHRHPLRSLNGAIDEFVIHAAVLATDEVRAMAEMGRFE